MILCFFFLFLFFPFLVLGTFGTLYLCFTIVFTVLNGKVMRKVGVEVMGLGALKLTGFLRELMQQNNIGFESLYTVRTLKEVYWLSFHGAGCGFWIFILIEYCQ